jgi:hypothetical protein
VNKEHLLVVVTYEGLIIIDGLQRRNHPHQNQRNSTHDTPRAQFPINCDAPNLVGVITNVSVDCASFACNLQVVEVYRYGTGQAHIMDAVLSSIAGIYQAVYDRWLGGFAPHALIILLPWQPQLSESSLEGLSPSAILFN